MRAARRRLIMSSITVALVVGFSSIRPAVAHVEVTPESVPRGSLSVMSFVVPNESPSASTISFQIEFPTTRPIKSAAVQPIPGWIAAVEKDPASDAVRRIVWTGGTFGPNEFQQFVVRATLPGRGQRVTFKAVQTYSDGEVVRWIQEAVKGAPEPEHPAPVVHLTKEESAHD